MMKKKKLCLAITATPHLARQLLLIKELQKHFDLDIWQPAKRTGSMASQAILYAVEFNNYLADNKFDAVIIRGDRFEMLGLTMVAAYQGVKIIHLEGGDLSGVIDNRVRHAITALSDYHFCTNNQSHRRLITMGVAPDKVWNFGSLDVEFADQVKPKKLHGKKPYIFVAYHPIEGENEKEIGKALKEIKGYDIVGVKSNTDYGKGYGTEAYSPEDYINMMRHAAVCVGNSSALIKEASILKVPVVNIGSRQINRLRPINLVDVPCDKDSIQMGVLYQLKRKFEKDLTYYQEDTSKNIVKQLKKVI